MHKKFSPVILFNGTVLGYFFLFLYILTFICSSISWELFKLFTSNFVQISFHTLAVIRLKKLRGWVQVRVDFLMKLCTDIRAWLWQPQDKKYSMLSSPFNLLVLLTPMMSKNIYVFLFLRYFCGLLVHFAMLSSIIRIIKKPCNILKWIFFLQSFFSEKLNISNSSHNWSWECRHEHIILCICKNVYFYANW